MEAIEKLSDIETGVCDDAHIYELSECMARMFEAVFSLYRVIPCYDRCHLLVYTLTTVGFLLKWCILM
jgi:hypothetical protein